MVSDEDFSKLLEEYSYSYKIGKIVEGTICAIENNYLLVDIKAKANAICPVYEILLPKNKTLKDIFEINEKYEFVINSQENEEGIFYLSHKKIALSKNLEVLEEKFKNDETIIGTIFNIVKGGIIVDVMGIKGFVPSSQLKIVNEKIGQEIELKILSLDLEKNNFILSNKKVYQDSIENIKKEILDKVELNMVVKGTVVRLTDFGAFVDIGGIDGLLPLSRMSWSWIDNPSDILKCGDIIDVEIIGIDKEKQRVSLSLKTLEPSPWQEAKDILKNGTVIDGKVTQIKPFGVFVEVYPKVEGLLNKFQIQEFYNAHKKELKEGQTIKVEIKQFDAKNEKINLEIIEEQ